MDVIERMREHGVVRWGIIGCGDVTEVKSGPAFRRVVGSSLQAVMRRDGERARDYAERHGVPRWTDDARDVIEADDVDAVYVATPPASHAAYVLQAAAAGKPVYVEKPMALGGDEGVAMVAACRAAGVPLYVAYYRRYLPRFERVRELLLDGAIGAPTGVRALLATLAPRPERAGWRWDRAVGGQGLLFDLGSHGLDLLDHWLGPIEAAHGEHATRLPWSNVPDAVVATLRFASGALGSAAWDFAAPRPADLITLIGETGELSVPLFSDGPVHLVTRGGDERREEIPHPPHVQEPLVAAIVAELLGRGGPALSTGESALRTQRVMDALVPTVERSPVRTG
jgi:1,5-anhydro-D-fructose reductase (1,5-anhydro-D-mannitol-forming)